MKIGRNDPCPCGSGKKYKHCHGSAASRAELAPMEAAEPAPVEQDAIEQLAIERAAIERAAIEREREAVEPGEIEPLDSVRLERQMAHIQKLLYRPGVDPQEEFIRLVENLLENDEFPEFVPETPLEEAQELAYQALEADGPEAIELAHKALAISPDVADAYVVLGAAAKSPEEALGYYQQGVAAGERAMGPELLAEARGELGSYYQAWGYLRARHDEALALQALGRLDEAIERLQDLLQLDEADTHGAHYLLLATLMQAGRWGEANKLLGLYPEDRETPWLYGRALAAFQAEGESRRARRLISKAFRHNPLVPLYLGGMARPPEELPAFFRHGDEAEAMRYAREAQRAWQAVPGSFDWLLRTVEAHAPSLPR